MGKVDGEFFRFTPSAVARLECSHENEPLGRRPQAQGRNSAMKTRTLWSRILIVIGGIAMLLGTLDPLEGSLLILPGSGLVTLGLFVGKAERRLLRYWLWVFILMIVGVGALFGLSAVGGFGGKSGLSIWWGLLLLPYPVAWIMGLASAICVLIRFFKARGQTAHC